jgi:hypothetical protein
MVRCAVSDAKSRSDMGMGIRGKLFGGFGIVLALLAVVGFIGWQNTSQFSADFKSLYADRMEPVVQLGNANTGLLQLRVQAAAYGAQSTDQRALARTAEPQWLKLIDDNIKAYEATYLLDEEVQGLKAWHVAYPA